MTKQTYFSEFYLILQTLKFVSNFGKKWAFKNWNIYTSLATDRGIHLHNLTSSFFSLANKRFNGMD